MNSGGEPERDEYGLPPVDIEIPDDARELDRDMQAYYRELRAERRRQRRRRLHGWISRDGIVLPLLACCLILALITGTLLTVFTATSDQSLTPLPGSGKPASRPGGAASSGASSATAAPSTPSSASSGAAAVTPGRQLSKVGDSLPAGRLVVSDQNVQLQTLLRTILVLMPPRCRCTAAVERVAAIGAEADATTLLVGTSTTISEAQQYEARLSPALSANVAVALDAQGVLDAHYRPSGLTLLLVAADGRSVSAVSQVRAGEPSLPLMQALAS